MTDLPASTERVRAAGEALGLAIDVIEMPGETRTAAEAARACGCAVAQIVKSLVFVGRESGRPFLLLVAGDNRVDEAGIAAHLGEALRRPDAGTVRTLTGYAIGGVPPFGHASTIATFIDESLLRHEVVWAAAGTPRAVFSVSPAALRDATRAAVIPVG